MVFNRKLGKSFKKIGEIYHFGRRDYPKELIEDIIKITKIKKESSILDVGCGTGKSTLPFAQKGYKITGIDISANMLNVAKRLSYKYKKVKYVKVSFEDIHLKSNSFDLILVGTAIHWLDPKRAYKKANLLLKEDGNIAIFWEPIYYLRNLPLKIKEILSKNCPNYPRDSKKNSMLIKIEKRLIHEKLFSKPKIKEYPSTQIYSKEEFFNLINSYSWVISLNSKKRKKIMRELNQFLEKRTKPLRLQTKFFLMVAKRR